MPNTKARTAATRKKTTKKEQSSPLTTATASSTETTSSIMQSPSNQPLAKRTKISNLISPAKNESTKVLIFPWSNQIVHVLDHQNHYILGVLADLPPRQNLKVGKLMHWEKQSDTLELCETKLKVATTVSFGEDQSAKNKTWTFNSGIAAFKITRQPTSFNQGKAWMVQATLVDEIGEEFLPDGLDQLPLKLKCWQQTCELMKANVDDIVYVAKPSIVLDSFKSKGGNDDDKIMQYSVNLPASASTKNPHDPNLRNFPYLWEPQIREAETLNGVRFFPIKTN